MASDLRISDLSSDVCSSDLQQSDDAAEDPEEFLLCIHASATTASRARSRKSSRASPSTRCIASPKRTVQYSGSGMCAPLGMLRCRVRSEEHTSELQSLMRISYAVFCLKKTKHRLRKVVEQCPYQACKTKCTE